MMHLSSKIIFINRRRTSMRLCKQEWEALSQICKKEKISRNALIETIENAKDNKDGLTYTTRLFMLVYFQNKFRTPSVQNINSVLQQII